jgi:hypothetical protein
MWLGDTKVLVGQVGEMLVELSVVGTFHLDDGDVRHVVCARLGWFRPKRRRRVTFASYE